jgi:hypothetical protein
VNQPAIMIFCESQDGPRMALKTWKRDRLTSRNRQWPECDSSSSRAHPVGIAAKPEKRRTGPCTPCLRRTDLETAGLSDRGIRRELRIVSGSYSHVCFHDNL